MGRSWRQIKVLASGLAKQYLSAGALSRFNAIAPSVVVPVSTPSPPAAPRNPARQVPATPSRPPSPPTVLSAELLNELGSNRAVARKIVTASVQKRDRKLAAQIRLLYDHECMICGSKLEIGEELHYSEAAHIKPLGTPHHGPDKANNLLVLCPNHHLQFDYGVVRLQRDSKGELRVRSKIKGDPLEGRKLSPKHALDDAYIRWHHEWFDDKKR